MFSLAKRKEPKMRLLTPAIAKANHSVQVFSVNKNRTRRIYLLLKNIKETTHKKKMTYEKKNLHGERYKRHGFANIKYISATSQNSQIINQLFSILPLRVMSHFINH